MARAPDAPNVVGGQLDPYVQQSMLQGQQQQSNRLLAAMQEKGATQRTGMQTASAERQQQVAGEQAMQRTAAENEQRDRQMASDEKSKEEDRKYNTMLQTQNQSFLAKESQLLREHDDAVAKHEEKRADDALERLKALHKADLANSIRMAQGGTKATLAFAKYSKQSQAAMMAHRIALTKTAEQAQNDKKVHDEAIESARLSLHQDKNFDRVPIDIKDTHWGTLESLRAKIAQMTPGRTTHLDSLQKQAPGLSLSQLTDSDKHYVVEGIAAGKIDPEHIRGGLASLEAGIKVCDERINETESDGEKKRWKSLQDDFSKRKMVLMGLKHDTKTPVVGKTNYTVGKVVNDAFGALDGSSSSAQISALGEQFRGDMGKAAEAYQDSIASRVDFGELIPLPPNATPAEVEAWDVVNRAIQATYPNLNPAAESSDQITPSRGPSLDQLDRMSADRIEGL